MSGSYGRRSDLGPEWVSRSICGSSGRRSPRVAAIFDVEVPNLAAMLRGAVCRERGLRWRRVAVRAGVRHRRACIERDVMHASHTARTRRAPYVASCSPDAGSRVTT